MASSKRNGSIVRSRKVTEQYGRGSDDSKESDFEFWLSQDDATKLAAVWELTTQAYLLKGINLSESRFPRSVASFERTPS